MNIYVVMIVSAVLGVLLGYLIARQRAEPFGVGTWNDERITEYSSGSSRMNHCHTHHRIHLATTRIGCGHPHKPEDIKTALENAANPDARPIVVELIEMLRRSVKGDNQVRDAELCALKERFANSGGTELTGMSAGSKRWVLTLRRDYQKRGHNETWFFEAHRECSPTGE